MSEFKVSAQSLVITREAAQETKGLRAWFSGFSSLLASLRSFLVTLAFFLALAGACLVVVDLVTRDEITLEPLSVPEALSKRGLSGDVAARQIEDKINRFLKRVDWARLPDKVESDFETPDFVEPATGMSLSAVINVLRDYLDIETTSVSGEILCAKADCVSGQGKLYLRVRQGDSLIRLDPILLDVNDPTEGFINASGKLVAQLMPYHAAVQNMKSQPDVSKQLAIAMLKQDHPRPSWGNVILGLVTFDAAGKETFTESQQHLRQQAKVYFERANQMYLEREKQHMEAALVNLGSLLIVQGDPVAAEKHYRMALEVRPTSLHAHAGLAEQYYIRAGRRDFTREQRALVLRRSAHWVDKGLALDPHHGILRARRAQLHFLLGEYQQAGQVLSQLHLEGKLTPELQWYLVDAHLRAGNTQTSLHLARTLDRSEADLFALKTYADVMLQHGPALEAVKGFKDAYLLALEQSPQSAEFLRTQWAEALVKLLLLPVSKTKCDAWFEHYVQYRDAAPTHPTMLSQPNVVGARAAECKLVMNQN